MPKGSGKGRHLPAHSRADFAASGLGIHCADRLFPSAVRAGIMATLAGLGWVLGRERDGLSSLAVAACSMLLLSPYLLYSLSFLLSFWITFGLLLCAPGLSRLWEQSALGAALIGRRGMPRFLHALPIPPVFHWQPVSSGCRCCSTTFMSFRCGAFWQRCFRCGRSLG